ncbi:MAG TPA: nuclear transport factor 2 family protein [Acidimicrobiales bacterium]|nr:nuclear transport factor 2 family protein [Acidimicrobiales bacterium]
MADETTEQRLRRLEDLEEIRQLFVDYGYYLDQKDFASYSQLFARNGEWHGGIGDAKGPAEIEAMLERAIGRGSGRPSAHIVANPIIHLDGDRATGRVTWVFLLGDDDTKPQLALVGHYEDTLIREDGRWRFLHRDAATDMRPARSPLP